MTGDSPDNPDVDPASQETGSVTPEKVVYGDERDLLPETMEVRLGHKYKYAKVEMALTDKTAEEKKGTGSKIHPINLFYRERAAEILEKRIQGWTILQLAKHYGVTVGTIEKVLKKDFDRLNKRAKESQDQIRQIHQERLAFMYQCLLPNMAKGHTRAIDMALKILERESKLLGLDAPEKKQVEMTLENISDSELIEQAKRLGVEVPEILRVVTNGDVVEGEIIPPEAIRDRPEATNPEAQDPQGQAEAGPGPGPV